MQHATTSFAYFRHSASAPPTDAVMARKPTLNVDRAIHGDFERLYLCTLTPSSGVNIYLASPPVRIRAAYKAAQF